jgi:hypothetical protein
VEREYEQAIVILKDAKVRVETPVRLLPGNGPPRPEGAFYELFCDSCVWSVALLAHDEDEHSAGCGHAVAHQGLAFCARCAMSEGACRKCGELRRHGARRQKALECPRMRREAVMHFR